jgi:hypothetical protein
MHFLFNLPLVRKGEGEVLSTEARKSEGEVLSSEARKGKGGTIELLQLSLS